MRWTTGLPLSISSTSRPATRSACAVPPVDTSEKPSPASAAATGMSEGLSASRTERNAVPYDGSGRPAARSAFANAVGKSRALAITSPVDRISGPSTGSAPRKRARGITGVDTRFLDVLHDRRDVTERSIAQCIDVDLDCILEEAVDEHAATDVAHRLVHLGGRVADAHRATAEHVRGTDEHWIADPLRDLPRLFGSLGDPPRRHPDPELVGQPAESLAVLGEVDRTERGAEDRDARCLERGRELQRRLP